jgi:hypothetical protein
MRAVEDIATMLQFCRISPRNAVFFGLLFHINAPISISRQEIRPALCRPDGEGSMKTKMMPLFVTIAAMLVASPVLADDLVFNVTNNSSDTLVELYASPSNEDNWGADIMSGQQLAAGEAGAVTIGGGSAQCDYDLRMVFSSGDTLEGSSNLCDAAGFTIQ